MADLSINSDVLLRTNKEDWKKALENYNVTEEFEMESLKSIKHWFSRQPHLPQIELEDNFVIRHLRSKNHSIEKVKELIDNYYSAKIKMPELLMNRDPRTPEVIEGFKQQLIVSLPQLTPEGHRITFIRKLSPNWNLTTSIKASNMISDYRLRNDTMIGEHFIFDLEPALFSDCMQFNPVITYKFFYYVISCTGAKVKGMHFVKTPPYAIPVINIIKKVVTPKVAQRIHLYDNIEEVMKIFPRKLFPSDLGGEEASTQELSDLWLQTLQSDPWRNFFLEQDKYVTDESKRIGKSNNFDDGFGLEGSFRKINID